MSSNQAKDQEIRRFYLTRAGRVVLACILVAVVIWPVGIQPQATQAAPARAPQTPTPEVPLAATAMPPGEEGPSEPSEPALGPVPLGPEQAWQAALSRMRTQVSQGHAPAWDGATLGDSIPLYDLRGEITAYLFPVSNGGIPAGYLTVAALQLPNPVLEFSTGGSTPLHGALDLAEQKGYRLTASQRPLYLGLLAYGYELVGPSTGRRLVLDLFTGGTFDVTEEEARVPLRQRVRPDATQPQAQTVQPMSPIKIDGVPVGSSFGGGGRTLASAVVRPLLPRM